jgi:P4 family phage/plasmid primase-like protien
LFTGGESKRPGRPKKAFNIEETYSYRDQNGKLLFEVCRMEPKDFRQRRPDATGFDGWSWNTRGVKQVPYRLPELIVAVKAGETVFVVEGEKDVGALVNRGYAATCNAGGAGKWRDEFAEHFDGAKAVVVIADKDAAGRAHAASVAQKLKPCVRSIKVVELPNIGASPVKDAADYFAVGGTTDGLLAIVAGVPEYIPTQELTPGAWFKQRFPMLADKCGEPVHETLSGKRARVRDISEDFMAATLGAMGRPDAPTVYLAVEERFYTYNPATGIFERQREDGIAAKVSEMFLECVKQCREAADLSKLEFGLRDSAALAGIIRRAKGILAVADDFFATDYTEFLPVMNGMLRLNDRSLLPFSPLYRCRHKLAVAHDAEAFPTRFVDTLLKSALDAEDISLVQRWSGLALIGVNLSQIILLLTGTAGGGKSTLVSVLTGIIGNGNVGLLRTEFLNDRFEIGRLMGKTLLYGPDVSEDFLSKRTASSLKSLSGGDMMTAEFKNSNESPQVKCQFNMIVTSNSRLTVFLEGDADAWRRRLVIVRYERGKPPVPIPNFAETIISEEGSGVLNFMLDGLEALRRDKWKLHLSDRQQARVDDLLLESDSHREFVRNCLEKDSLAPGMTKAEVFTAYVEYCERREWIPMAKARFGKLGSEVIAQEYGLSVRGDICGPDGKQNDGWKFLRLKAEKDGIP